ncbi:MAG: hypothetical protein H8E98_04490 [Bacteroidetes bacterium]|nr:hypothetical protein [Bacteroidota bacterium]
MLKCKFCNSERKNKNSLVQHQIRCKENPNKIEIVTSNFVKYVEDVRSGKRRGSNQYIKAKELGLLPPIISETTRKIMGEKAAMALKKYYSNPENRKKQSDTMKKAVSEHPESYSSNNVCGRVKSVDFVDSFGKDTKLNGKWEVKFAEFLTSKNIKWTNDVKPEPYFWKESWHMYFPDFYLPDLDVYIEVKGYERDRDRKKWKQFPKKLVVVKQKEINDLDEWYDKYFVGYVSG